MPLLKNSTLTLYGQVSAEALPDSPSFSALDVRNALDEHGEGNLSVNLNSAGGNAVEGLAIYNALKNHNGKVTINIDAVALSAASLIAMAGDEIVMRDGALIMIHDPRGGGGGTSAEHRGVADVLDTLSSQFRSIYVKRTGRTDKEIGDMMAAETWMDADKAIRAGFATRKSDGEGLAPIYASFDYGKFRNTPAFLLQSKGTKMPKTNEIDEQIEKPWSGRFLMSATNSGLDLAALTEIVNASDKFETARDALIDAMASAHNKSLPSPTGARRPSGETYESPTFLERTVGDVLYAKMSGTAPTEPARELMGLSMLDLGARLIEARGERISWRSRDALASQVMMSEAGAHSTSDFPNLVGSAGQRVLLDAYKAAQSPLRTLAKVRNASDFRPLTALRLSEAPALVEKPEGGELSYGSRSETKETFGLKTFGRIFSLTREALINDDLGAFADSSRAWGQAAASLEADQIVALFTANSGNGANLDDANPLYTTVRKNKAASGGAISVTTLDAARQAMRGVKSVDGKTILNMTAKHMVVAPAKETEAQQFLSALQAQEASNVNPFAGTLSLHVEPRFAGNAWRLFTDPADVPTIVVAYLNGAQGPQLATRQGWTTLGLEFRAVLDFGCGLEDWRGTYLNPGN